MYFLKVISISITTSLLFFNSAVSADANKNNFNFTKEFSDRFYDEKTALPSLGSTKEKKISDVQLQVAEAEKSNESASEDATSKGGFDVATAAKKANNPVSDAWLLIVQNDYTWLRGDAIDGVEKRERFSAQPIMPIPVFGGDWNLVNRPVIQWFSSPVDDDLDSTDPFGDRTNGLGDTISFHLLAPNRDDGWIWGVGPTFIWPTATEDVLGQEKWQAGPAALVARLGKEHGGLGIESWNLGILAQQWWDYAGSGKRESTNQADIQYFINWKQGPTRLIGMTPNIQINWKESGSDRFSVPIGLGTIDLFKVGKVPVRWGAEVQYYVNQPDDFGPKWNLKLFIAPIAPNPFKK